MERDGKVACHETGRGSRSHVCVQIQVARDIYADAFNQCTTKVWKKTIVLLSDGTSENFVMVQHMSKVDVKSRAAIVPHGIQLFNVDRIWTRWSVSHIPFQKGSKALTHTLTRLVGDDGNVVQFRDRRWACTARRRWCSRCLSTTRSVL